VLALQHTQQNYLAVELHPSKFPTKRLSAWVLCIMPFADDIFGNIRGTSGCERQDAGRKVNIK
jgi:hypothetical protein